VEREDWNRRWAERGFHCEDDPIGIAGEEIETLAPGRALDLGCGAGRAAVWLAARGWRVTGVDFSETALELGRATGADVDWVLADAREYEPEPGAFDLVLVLYIHLPVSELGDVLDRARGALAPGGTLVVAGHDVANIGTGAPGPTNPDLLYTAAGLTAELAGLDVRRAEPITRPVGPGVEAVDTLVVARRR
jgi:SAM-dependent methyltransferase